MTATTIIDKRFWNDYFTDHLKVHHNMNFKIVFTIKLTNSLFNKGEIELMFGIPDYKEGFLIGTKPCINQGSFIGFSEVNNIYGYYNFPDDYLQFDMISGHLKLISINNTQIYPVTILSSMDIRILNRRRQKEKIIW